MDADLAGDINDRRSTTGYLFCMNKFSSPIAFYSGVQHCVATSTAHSEMLAAAKAVVMVIHLRELLEELSLGEIDVTSLYEDNSAVVAMSQNAINGSATMHCTSPSRVRSCASRSRRACAAWSRSARWSRPPMC